MLCFWICKQKRSCTHPERMRFSRTCRNVTERAGTSQNGAAVVLLRARAYWFLIKKVVLRVLVFIKCMHKSGGWVCWTKAVGERVGHKRWAVRHKQARALSTERTFSFGNDIFISLTWIRRSKWMLLHEDIATTLHTQPKTELIAREIHYNNLSYVWCKKTLKMSRRVKTLTSSSKIP